MARPSSREWSPVARFSVALGLILAITALALSGLTAYLIGRYVSDETAVFTTEAVSGHFGTIFRDDVFDRQLAATEATALEGNVIFHFAIYHVVATQFFRSDGTIAFSYDPTEIGRKLDPAATPGLAAALAGHVTSTHRDVVADLRYGRPGFTLAEANGYPPAGHAAHSANLGRPEVRDIGTLESWVPIRRDGQVIGAAVTWRDVEPIDAALRQIQLSMGGIIALGALILWLVLRNVYVRSSQRIVAQAVALGEALKENERTYDATLAALSSALDVRDTETEGHARRVVRYMQLIADVLVVPVSEHATLRRGALLHDIGKIGVPDHILRKPGPLTDAEWATMHRHPDLGAKIIGNVPFLEDVAMIIRAHHERWDGEGYPEGLAGESIPLGARIFAVADSFDAMTSDRPYRRGRPLDEALAEVERCAGTQFDPAVVRAFGSVTLAKLEAIHDSAPYALRRGIAASA